MFWSNIALLGSARCPFDDLGIRIFIKSFFWVVHPHLSSRTGSCSTNRDFTQSRGQICPSLIAFRRPLLEGNEAEDRGKVASPTKHLRRRRTAAAGSFVVGHGPLDWQRGGAAMKIDV